MAKPMVELIGDEEVARALREIGEVAVTAMVRITMDAAEPLRDEIRANAPRDSGEMASSIDMFAIEPKDGLTTMVGVGPKGDYFYWRFVEMGTKHIKAQKFIRPAYARHENRISEKIKEGLNRILEEYGGD